MLHWPLHRHSEGGGFTFPPPAPPFPPGLPFPPSPPLFTLLTGMGSLPPLPPLVGERMQFFGQLEEIQKSDHSTLDFYLER